MARYGDYQYDTTPRKIEPEYTPRTRTNSKSTTTVKTKKTKKASTVNQRQKKQLQKVLKKKRSKTVAYVLLGFAVLLTISYRNSLITENFNKVEDLKKELSVLKKENEQLEVSIQNSLNLNNIEQAAKEKLGMQKLTSKQTVYVNLPKKDYVEPSSEKIIMEEKNWFEQLMDKIKSIF